MTAAPRESRAVSDLRLEQYALEELAPAARAALDRALAESPALRTRLDALVASDADIRAGGPIVRLAGGVAAGAARHRGQRRMALATAMATLLAVVSAATWRWTIDRQVDPPPVTSSMAPDGERVKGTGAALAIYRQTAGGSEALRDGDAARTGDVLRVGYQAARAGYGAILSVDGRGTVTRHYPPAGAAAAPLSAGALVLLNEAFELDDAPRWERFHLFASDRPFDLEPLVRGLGADPATVPTALEHATLSLAKEPPR